ncbi:MAG: nucleotidyltransferase domain-containing protein [Patescibacteria group bacterium]
MTYTPAKLSSLAAKRIKRQLPAGYRVVLFGSWAKGTAIPTSDIDLGIVGKQPLPFDLYCRILESLEDMPTIRKIDFVDLGRMSKEHRRDILKYAKTL